VLCCLKVCSGCCLGWHLQLCYGQLSTSDGRTHSCWYEHTTASTNQSLSTAQKISIGTQARQKAWLGCCGGLCARFCACQTQQGTCTALLSLILICLLFRDIFAYAVMLSVMEKFKHFCFYFGLSSSATVCVLVLASLVLYVWLFTSVC